MPIFGSIILPTGPMLHGDDEDDSETGFHLVQNDGATTQLFGDENAVNTVADGIYHLGFAIEDGSLLNEDGNANASLKDVAFWLNELLASDLAGQNTRQSDTGSRTPKTIAAAGGLVARQGEVEKPGDQLEIAHRSHVRPGQRHDRRELHRGRRVGPQDAPFEGRQGIRRWRTLDGACSRRAYRSPVAGHQETWTLKTEPG